MTSNDVSRSFFSRAALRLNPPAYRKSKRTQ